MTTGTVLRRITQALEQTGIEYMLTGSFASSFYGALRSTQDIDFVIAVTPEQIKNFALSLPTTEYYVDVDAALRALERHSLFNVIDLATGWKIDFIVRKPRAFSQEEFRRRKPAKMEDASLFIASPEDVIIAKLEWSKLAQSRRQLEDASAILKVHWNTLDRAYLERWVSQLGLEPEWQQAESMAGS